MALTESTMLELGVAAPDFTLTDTVTGKTVSRDDFRGQKALLVLFICAHCPYVKHIEKALAALGNDYSEEPIAIVAISSNDASTHPPTAPRDSSSRLKLAALSSPTSTTNRSPWLMPTKPPAPRTFFSSTQIFASSTAANSIPAAPATRFLSQAKTFAPPSTWFSQTSRFRKIKAPLSAAISSGSCRPSSWTDDMGAPGLAFETWEQCPYSASSFKYARNCGPRSARLSANSTVACNMPNLSPASYRLPSKV